MVLERALGPNFMLLRQDNDFLGCLSLNLLDRIARIALAIIQKSMCRHPVAQSVDRGRASSLSNNTDISQSVCDYFQKENHENFDPFGCFPRLCIGGCIRRCSDDR